MVVGAYLENNRRLIRDLRLTKEERILNSSSLSESNKARLRLEEGQITVTVLIKPPNWSTCPVNTSDKTVKLEFNFKFLDTVTLKIYLTL